MIRTVRVLMAGAALTVVSSAVRADLRWEATEVEISPTSTDVLTPVEFRFTNTGLASVQIKEVRPDCSCVVPAAATRTYEPGETGSVSVVFKSETQLERRDVPIEVTVLNGGDTSHAVLVLHVRVRELVQFSERFVYWRATQPLEPRTVFATVRPEDGLKLQSASSDSPAFQVTLTHTADPNKYALLITPPPEHGRAFATITVTSVSATDPTPKVHRLVARVW